ncbi:MAG: chemotaxis response regulator protein-glutamate methylesterase [Paenisporosarcina sp.]
MFLDGKKKLLIVDDSAFMRKIIGDFFFDHPKIDVIGTARNGKDALMKIKSLKPDVVTMDIEMPEMNGIEALKLIMAEHPVPIVMLSSTTDSGTENTMLAMEYGAVDFVAKPSGTISLDLHKIKDELVEKILEASQVPLKKIRNSEVRNLPNNPVFIENSRSSQKVMHSNKGNDHAWSASRKKIVLIGTSTGGPRALQEVLTRLPKDIKSPILIVQHMPAGFTKSLASRLDQLSDIHVKEAEHGEELVDGTAYIAPGGYHLIVSRIGKTYSVELNDKLPPQVGHRPSVDVLFESVSQIKEVDKIAVIMTGMGSDGSKGLIQLKENGVVKTISESADTCIVYGMPKAAYETGLIDEVADVEDIAKIIMKFLP